VNKPGLAVLIIGVLGILLGGGTLLVSVLLPSLTSGRTSYEEAMLGIIPGALVLFLSLVIALVGLVVIILKRKKKSPV
jgi:hypothetical protein